MREEFFFILVVSICDVLDFLGRTIFKIDYNLADKFRVYAKPSCGRVYIVGAGPGEADLITVKGKSLLRSATCVVFDRLVNQDLLREISWKARKINVGKAPKKKRFPQEEINAILVEEARKGHMVVRLKGGDPFVYGLGGDECKVLSAEDIEFTVVPGVSSAFAVPAYAGIPVTQKGVSTGVLVLSGHLAPEMEGAADFSKIPDKCTIVILMGTAKLAAITDYLIRKGIRLPTTPAAVIQSGTTSIQKTLVTTLDLLAQESELAGLGSPSVVVIGGVVSCREEMQWFLESPLSFESTREEVSPSAGSGTDRLLRSDRVGLSSRGGNATTVWGEARPPTMH